MNNRFGLEIFEAEPFSFEEDETDRSSRRGRVASRQPAARRQAQPLRRKVVRPRSQHPGPRHPVRYRVLPVPYPAWPGLLPTEPAEEPPAQEPPMDTVPEDPSAQQPGTDQDSELESEVDRGSYDYAVWVQRSLNRLMGLRLVEDGIIGTLTRSAIRSFQERYGLLVDGIVGPQTEGALIKAGAAPPPGDVSSYPPAPPKTGTPAGSFAWGAKVSSE